LAGAVHGGGADMSWTAYYTLKLPIAVGVDGDDDGPEVASPKQLRDAIIGTLAAMTDDELLELAGEGFEDAAQPEREYDREEEQDVAEMRDEP
jgi:hypothetical protein